MKYLWIPFIILAITGFSFGFFRHRWEHGRMPAAYPAAVRLSRWLGFLVAAMFFLYELRQDFGGRMAMLMLFGVFVLAPVSGILVCGISRPFIYLAALFYYRDSCSSKSQD